MGAEPRESKNSIRVALLKILAKKKKKKIITKTKSKAKSFAPKQEKELIYRTKKDWISKALVNKSQYEKKYKASIKDNDSFWKK